MIARRPSSGAGFVHDAPAGSISGAVRGMDLYAKVPRELAEGSVTGGVISGCMVRRVARALSSLPRIAAHGFCQSLFL